MIPPFLFNKNLWLIVGVLLAAWALAAWHNAKVAGAREEGYGRGLKDERLVWQVRENEELNAKNALITQLQEKYRALEKKSADDVVAVTHILAGKLHETETKLEKALVDARAGTAFRLRWAASCAPTRKDAGGDPTPSSGAATGGAVATAACELPRSTTEDLIRLAGDADRVVAERNALLTIAQKDREVCK
jgi:hypothetical protein